MPRSPVADQVAKEVREAAMGFMEADIDSDQLCFFSIINIFSKKMV